MEFVPWNESYSVNIPSIDEQHKKLLAYINELHAGILHDPEDTTIIEATLEKLHNYAVEHFAYEEKLLRSYGYPDYMKHKQAHNEFFRKLKAFDTQEDKVTQELLFFLQNWLIKHIKGTDAEYSPFLREKGVR